MNLAPPNYREFSTKDLIQTPGASCSKSGTAEQFFDGGARMLSFQGGGERAGAINKFNVAV